MITETFSIPVVEGLILEGQRANEDQRQLEEVAEAWLREHAEEIGAILRKQYNPYDLDLQRSFELIVDINEPTDEEDGEALGEFDRVWLAINRIHEEYSREFADFL